MKLIITNYGNGAKAWHDIMFVIIFRIIKVGIQFGKYILYIKKEKQKRNLM